VEKDGGRQEVLAVATCSADLRGEALGIDGLVFMAAGLAFDVVEVLPGYNPDGSFHHISFRLRQREMERVGDVSGHEGCAESGGR